MIMSDFPSRWSERKRGKIHIGGGEGGCGRLCARARELRAARVFSERNEETVWKTARRVHCRETILHDDPVSFICSLNSCALHGRTLVTRTDFHVCVRVVSRIVFSFLAD